MSFARLELNESILKAVDRCGFDSPTAIQRKAIPEVMSGRDVMASAQTGTGKTAAFVLPVLHRLSLKRERRMKARPRVLVLSPTRELAQQVVDETRRFGRFMDLKCAVILGGMSYRSQFKALAGNVDIVVGTPGRLVDHLCRGSLNLSGLEVLILDEADRMLDMGFRRDVDKITRAAAKTRQTLLFTATMDGATAGLAKTLMNEPVRIDMAQGGITVDSIEQHVYLADGIGHKRRLLMHMIEDHACARAVVFSSTKRGAEELARELKRRGYKAAALHGDMSQADRRQTMTKMRKGRLRLLVATDVAARGLDVAGITHVINFDLPQAPQDYVHRIGRTGRAGAAGIAISIACGSKDAAQLKAIERFIGKRISRRTIPGLEPTSPPPRPVVNTRSFRPGRKKKRFSLGLKGVDSSHAKRSGTVRIVKR